MREHQQSVYAVRMDWGLTGARALTADARPGDLAVVVDVLSFTTCTCVALERGIDVHPYPWAGAEVGEYAAARGARVAVGRQEGRRTGRISLSPATLATAEPGGAVVLPSPNGSTISFELASLGATVVAASLRNAGAVATWLGPRLAAGARVAVVAAGERWPDGSLRPAVEDLWGAGAVLAGLTPGDLSPEARAAVAAYSAVVGHLGVALADCAGGRELQAIEFGEDVTLAAELDAADVVPVLDDGVFRDLAQNV